MQNPFENGTEQYNKWQEFWGKINNESYVRIANMGPANHFNFDEIDPEELYSFILSFNHNQSLLIEACLDELAAIINNDNLTMYFRGAALLSSISLRVTLAMRVPAKFKEQFHKIFKLLDHPLLLSHRLNSGSSLYRAANQQLFNLCVYLGLNAPFEYTTMQYNQSRTGYSEQTQAFAKHNNTSEAKSIPAEEEKEESSDEQLEFLKTMDKYLSFNNPGHSNKLEKQYTKPSTRQRKSRIVNTGPISFNKFLSIKAKPTISDDKLNITRITLVDIDNLKWVFNNINSFDAAQKAEIMQFLMEPLTHYENDTIVSARRISVACKDESFFYKLLTVGIIACWDEFTAEQQQSVINHIANFQFCQGVDYFCTRNFTNSLEIAIHLLKVLGEGDQRAQLLASIGQLFNLIRENRCSPAIRDRSSTFLELLAEVITSSTNQELTQRSWVEYLSGGELAIISLIRDMEGTDPLNMNVMNLLNMRDIAKRIAELPEANRDHVIRRAYELAHQNDWCDGYTMLIKALLVVEMTTLSKFNLWCLIVINDNPDYTKLPRLACLIDDIVKPSVAEIVRLHINNNNYPMNSRRQIIQEFNLSSDNKARVAETEFLANRDNNGLNELCEIAEYYRDFSPEGQAHFKEVAEIAIREFEEKTSDELNRISHSDFLHNIQELIKFTANIPGFYSLDVIEKLRDTWMTSLYLFSTNRTGRLFMERPDIEAFISLIAPTLTPDNLQPFVDVYLNNPDTLYRGNKMSGGYYYLPIFWEKLSEEQQQSAIDCLLSSMLELTQIEINNEGKFKNSSDEDELKVSIALGLIHNMLCIFDKLDPAQSEQIRLPLLNFMKEFHRGCPTEDRLGTPFECVYALFAKFEYDRTELAEIPGVEQFQTIVDSMQGELRRIYKETTGEDAPVIGEETTALAAARSTGQTLTADAPPPVEGEAVAAVTSSTT